MTIATRALAGLFAAVLTVSADAVSGPVTPARQADGTGHPATAASGAPQTEPGKNEKQERRTKWWKDEAIMKELGLSISQCNKVDQIWESTVPSLRAAYEEMEGLEAELSRLIRENTADEKVVALQIDRVEALRSQINKARTLMLYRMHRVLNAAQHQALTKIMDARRQARERRDGKRP